MTFHTRKCELCERLFTFKTNKQDLKHLWRCVECRKPKAAEETNPVRGRNAGHGTTIDSLFSGRRKAAI